MPSFIPGSKVIQKKLADNIGQFPALPVSPATLATQISDVETVHLETKTNKGLIQARTAKVDALWISFEADCTYVEGLCQQSPEQGLALAAASGFHVMAVGEHKKEIITITLEIGKGIAHLEANTTMLPAPSGKKAVARTYLWRHSIDGGKTIVVDEGTPTARTVISGLPLQVEASFGVAVKDSTGTGPWSQWITAFVH